MKWVLVLVFQSFFFPLKGAGGNSSFLQSYHLFLYMLMVRTHTHPLADLPSEGVCVNSTSLTLQRNI